MYLRMRWRSDSNKLFSRVGLVGGQWRWWHRRSRGIHSFSGVQAAKRVCINMHNGFDMKSPFLIMTAAVFLRRLDEDGGCSRRTRLLRLCSYLQEKYKHMCRQERVRIRQKRYRYVFRKALLHAASSNPDCAGQLMQELNGGSQTSTWYANICPNHLRVGMDTVFIQCWTGTFETVLVPIWGLNRCFKTQKNQQFFLKNVSMMKWCHRMKEGAWMCLGCFI